MGMMLKSTVKKIDWITHPSKELYLTARAVDQSRGLTENDIDVIQEWCQTNGCGIRTSFDTFRFRSDKDMTLFLLKWAK